MHTHVLYTLLVYVIEENLHITQYSLEYENSTNFSLIWSNLEAYFSQLIEK
jgi:hypothetical protein